MKSRILSINELEELLATEEYEYTEPPREYIKEFESSNSWTDGEVFKLFDKLTEQAGGKPPKPNDYLNEAFRLTKEFWFQDSEEGRLGKYKMVNGYWQVTYLKWTESMERAVKWRLSRMYESLMVEYSAISISHSIYPEAHLVTSYELDLCAGVDLAIVSEEHNKIAYVHVTKNSRWTNDNIAKKAMKSCWLKDKNGNKHYWQRRFTDSHTVLAYDKFDSDTTQYLNGHFIFRTEHVQGLLKEKFEEDLDVVKGGESELIDFHMFLKKNKIDKNGISDMIITFTLNNKS